MHFSIVLHLFKSKIPSSVNLIVNYAFNKCSSLKHITIPSSVKSIGDYSLLFIDQNINSFINVKEIDKWSISQLHIVSSDNLSSFIKFFNFYLFLLKIVSIYGKIHKKQHLYLLLVLI